MNIAQNWRLNNQRYALVGVRCETCGQVTFPPREVCPHCQEREAQKNQNNDNKIAAFPVIILREELQRAGR